MPKKNKKKEQQRAMKKHQAKQDAQVGESDPGRGLTFNNMLTSAMPRTWERTNLDSPRRPPSNRPTTIEDIVCPRCFSIVEHGHEDDCPNL